MRRTQKESLARHKNKLKQQCYALKKVMWIDVSKNKMLFVF